MYAACYIDNKCGGAQQLQDVFKSIHAQKSGLSFLSIHARGTAYISPGTSRMRNRYQISVCRKILYTLMSYMSTIISRVIENGIAKVDGRIIIYEKDRLDCENRRRRARFESHTQKTSLLKNCKVLRLP